MEMSLIFVAGECVIVGSAVAWVGSRRHVWGALFTSIVCGVLCVMMADALCKFFDIPHYEWQTPIMLLVASIGCQYYAWFMAGGEPVTVADVTTYVGRMFADGRRRTAMRASVRRVAKQYRVEVA